MIELLSSRSRVSNWLSCPRARWWLDEAQGTGFSPLRVSLPLATGGAVHKGLAELLRGAANILTRVPNVIEKSAQIGIQAYEAECQDRGLDLDLLESQSFVFNEQRALTEALVRVAGMRVIPQLLETYEVLEVERMDTRPLGFCEGFSILWRSIPDALLRHRESRDLYLLSWKTAAFLPFDDPGRIDMQGVSEAWGLQARLDEYARKIATGTDEEDVPKWFREIYDHWGNGSVPGIRGVQMIYLVKGTRRAGSKELRDQIFGEGSPGEVKKTASPLIYGYADSSVPAKLATDLYWTCQEPHPFRYAKGGVCPGGKNHRRGDDWKSFPVWGAMGVKEWIRMLDAGEVTPEAGDVLDAQWAMPVPFFRTDEQRDDWLSQTRASEVRIARDLLRLWEAESRIKELYIATGGWESSSMDQEFNAMLNSSVLGPQNASKCSFWYGGKCPCHDLCWGPDHIRRDPVGSGIYRIKPAKVAEVEVEE